MLDLAAGLTDTSRLGCQVVSHLNPPKLKKAADPPTHDYPDPADES